RSGVATITRTRPGVAVHSEEDAKQKIIMPYLRSLGYSEKEMRFENPITVQAGSRKVTLYSDIEILVDGRPEIIIDAKKPSHTINDTDVLQVTSYAKLVDVQSAYCAFVTNGHDLKGVNVSTGAAMPGIPSKNQLISSLSRRPKNILTGIQLREVRSTLVTIMSQDVLYRVIKECKDIIEKQALIRSDQSFKEMTKILLVKMNEERRALKEARENRFSRQWLQVSAEASGAQQLEVFRKLFEEATNKYSGIYDDDDVSIQIKDEDALLKVVDRLEPFSFLGTGDDIKGAVYEIFLKTTLRGEFDQYFTPRELVDYIVEASDPQYGERFVDPAAGSGGFLIKAFTHVNQVLQTSGRPAHDILVDERELVEKHIWGQEADYDLHVLTKINMIMHGDGWNNIYQGDSLLGGHLPYGTFDLVLENPPFTTSYGNKAVLKNYETAFGRDSQELDILFVELSIRLLKPGGRMFIILPEGLLNLPAYRDFRDWLLGKVWLSQTISLPAGAFQPFGRSASKTCILAVIKKDATSAPPKYVFGAVANNIGYDTGKTTYKALERNDLVDILKESQEFFSGVHQIGRDGSVAAWCPQSDINTERIDAGRILSGAQNEDGCTPLGEMFDVKSDFTPLNTDSLYSYLEVPWISDIHGCIQRIDSVKGSDLTASRLRALDSGDIYLTRINPRKKRIGIVPTDAPHPVMVSGEVYTLKWKDNNHLPYESRYAIIPILRSDAITQQICNLSTGSSSSRARISVDSLKELQIPTHLLGNRHIAEEQSKNIQIATDAYWNAINSVNHVMESIL
ncbi:N-6 DNA methylase, partial [Bifidobacterium longum]